jgi:hypothetical protein
LNSIIAWVALMLAAGCDSGRLCAEAYDGATISGVLTDRRLTEASGMAASRLNPGRYWVHNDGGHEQRLFLIDQRGFSQGSVLVDQVKNIDWEDMASFEQNGKSWLAIGDIGDNGGVRGSLSIHVFEEPAVAQEQTLTPAWSIEFTLEDEPHDIESMAVDVQSDQFLLLTKRAYPSLLYGLPIHPKTAPNTARIIATVRGIPRPTQQEIDADPAMGKYRKQPTAMDIDPSGQLAVVLTYQHGYLFDRREDESWAEAMTRSPTLLRLPPIPQGEAVAFGPEGVIVATSEKWPAPVMIARPSR